MFVKGSAPASFNSLLELIFTNPRTRIPALTAAVIPGILSSIITHSSFENPILSTAYKNRSGAGLGYLTSEAV